MFALSEEARAEAVASLDATIAQACGSAIATLPKSLASLPFISTSERCAACAMASVVTVPLLAIHASRRDVRLIRVVLLVQAECWRAVAC